MVCAPLVVGTGGLHIRLHVCGRLARLGRKRITEREMRAPGGRRSVSTTAEVGRGLLGLPCAQKQFLLLRFRGA